MNKRKILVVDDEMDVREFLCDIIDEMGFHAEGSNDGSSAMEKLLYNKYDLYIVDYNMPIMNGDQFITRLKLQEPDAVVVMLTGNSESHVIINIMKLGVYDYILKPIKLKTIEDVVKKAIQHKEQLEQQREMQIKAGRVIQSKIEWNEYKESRTSDKPKITAELIHSLQTNMLQGAGISVAISITEMIDEIKKEDKDGNIVLDKDLINLLISNNQTCKNQLNSLANSFSILSKEKLALSPFPTSKVSSIIKDIVTRLEEPVKEKMNSEFVIGSTQANHEIKIHKDFFGILLEELIINASKYTMQNSKIGIYSYIQDGYTVFAVKNSIQKEELGVPKNYEKLVTEPFFRLAKSSEDLFYSYNEKFLLGLGLTVVNHITRLHNGLFWIKNALDHTARDNSKYCVLAEVALPI
ncbi:MAG: hybrid sensor histidine kinase/response regulator [Leptospiraceae bacterium]|nr:hybrid sensor histidine kinase/response regulator [Leptospiraceae bacterium]